MIEIPVLDANRVDPDHVCSVASDLGLHCLPMSHFKTLGINWLKRQKSYNSPHCVWLHSVPFRVVSAGVVSALSHFGPGLFRPRSFRPGSFRPWVISANFVGSFRLDFLSPPRLRIIGRTIIWLFDEESSPSSLGVIDRILIWLFDEESSDYHKGLKTYYNWLEISHLDKSITEYQNKHDN